MQKTFFYFGSVIAGVVIFHYIYFLELETLDFFYYMFVTMSIIADTILDFMF